MAEKMRVHVLAKELNVSSKVIIAKCKAEGVDSVKNHMSTLSAGLHATIREWFSEGGDSALETSERVDLKKVVKKPRAKKKKKKVAAGKTADKDVGVVVAEAPAPSDGAVLDDSIAQPPDPITLEPSRAETEEPPASLDVAAETEVEEATQAAEAVAGEAPVQPTAMDAPEPSAEEEDLEGDETGPAGPQHVPEPAKLRGPRVVRYEAPEQYERPVRSAESPRRSPGSDAPAQQPAPAPGSGDSKKGGRKRGRMGRRGADRLIEAGERMSEWGNKDLVERQERLAGATGRRISRRRTVQTGGAQRIASGPKTEATVHEPIRMKEFCSATGLNFMQLFRVLRDEHNMMPNINMTLPTETAELLALNFGITLTVVADKTKLDHLREAFEQRERANEQIRPPVVTMLGHVDHGKTSLLDAIRATHVVAGEDGGITQHISSYHVQSGHGPVTFLDTPGHAAFTAMRQRGAQLTDVVVLVVAADDGIMPQTVEAINHAKSAEVPIVVALNKIDLGDENKVKIFGQLAEHGLTPAGDWGGEVDVIETSATTGEGVTKLVEHLADLSSVMEFKADATLPAFGTAVEAETKEGVGPVVRALIQDGSLSVGDFVVCGNASGKVRAILNDRGKKITKAGPSIPVEVWGLDAVPSAGDRLYQVETLQRAKDIAAETKHVRVEQARLQSSKVTTLQEMLTRRSEADVPVLNIIIKGDVDGSVVALQQSLAEIPNDEVTLTFRHTGVGAVNDSDILLAAACDGVIIAYRVDVAVGARRLADQHRVDVRSYRVIYDVCDDIKKALEGLLAPEESIESRGMAEVKEVFRLSKRAGVVAGSAVTDGTINRNFLVKILRNGVVVRERCSIASLRRFKDDVKEVRSGMECGIRLEGFDDLHVGDVVEAYEVIQTARTL